MKTIKDIIKTVEDSDKLCWRNRDICDLLGVCLAWVYTEKIGQHVMTTAMTGYRKKKYYATSKADMLQWLGNPENQDHLVKTWVLGKIMRVAATKRRK